MNCYKSARRVLLVSERRCRGGKAGEPLLLPKSQGTRPFRNRLVSFVSLPAKQSNIRSLAFVVFRISGIYGISSQNAIACPASTCYFVNSTLKPYFNAVFGHILFSLAYGVFTVVKNAGSQHRVGMALYNSFRQMAQAAYATARDHRQIHSV